MFGVFMIKGLVGEYIIAVCDLYEMNCVCVCVCKGEGGGIGFGFGLGLDYAQGVKS
jgi:hypothetical protein